MYNYLLHILQLLGLYVYRCSFVLSMYLLLLTYGLFSKKKKIIPFKYLPGDTVEGSKHLTHGFTNLSNLKTGVRFHYVSNLSNVSITKDDCTVVFLHGIFESWYAWKQQLILLDNMGIRCIAIDFKNHGNTSAHYAGSIFNNATDLGKNFDLTWQGREILELLHMLNIKNVLFVTSDLGSLVCDKIIREFYCPNVKAYIRCHEPLVGHPNDKGLVQQYMFWFNKRLSLFLMHHSNEMILRLFYKGTGWTSVESFGATYHYVENLEEHCRNAINYFESGVYKGHNSNYMAWAGAYAYAFINDICTGPILNFHAYENCKFPVIIVTGFHDKSTLVKYINGDCSLGVKFINEIFCTKMITYNGEDGYDFFNGENEKGIITKPKSAKDYFPNSLHCKIFYTYAGHATHYEIPNDFSKILLYAFDLINKN